MLDTNELDKLPGNIVKVANTYQKYNIRKIYISPILPSTRTNINIFDINKKLRQQITTKFLWNDVFIY